MRQYFLETERLGFSNWSLNDGALAASLWGEPEVTRYICASGMFSPEDIQERLRKEVDTYQLHHVQYYPVFELTSGKLAGCCGFRPFESEKNIYELGFHLRKEFWHKGYGFEAGTAAIQYGFHILHMDEIRAGHHPDNAASRTLLTKLGFQYIGDTYYAPTGLNHPSYRLKPIQA